MPPDEQFVPNLGQLVSASLAGIDFRRNPDWDPDVDNVLAFTLDVDRGDVHSLGTRTYTDITAAIVWQDVDGEPIVPPFDLRIVVAGEFDWSSDTEASFRIGWTEFNGLYLLFPYLRSYVATLTALSGGPPLHLPTFALPRPSFEPGETSEFQALPREPGPTTGE